MAERKYSRVKPTCIYQKEEVISYPSHSKTATPPLAQVSNSLQDILKKVGEGQRIYCGNCHVTNATRYCKECATVYCEECLIYHNKLEVNISHNIIDIKNEATNVCRTKQEAIMNCTTHNKPLEMFCKTCQKLICKSCTTHCHQNHEYDTITNVLPKQRQEIEANLLSVKKKIKATNEVLNGLTKRKKEIIKQRDDTKRDIHLHAQQIIESIQHCENLLVQQVDASVQHKLRLLGEQVKEVETALVQLKSCEKYIEQSLEVGSQQQTLSEKQKMIQGMEVASKQINPEKPVEEADIRFTRNKAAIDDIKSIGEVHCSFSCPSKPRKVIKCLDKLQCIAVNSEGVMVVGGEGDNCITVMDSNGRIVRSFGLNGKYGECLGVAFITDGHIVVSDGHSHKLYKLTLQGEYIASVGGYGSSPMKFDSPCGIAVHPTTGQIYVADRNNNRIQVINNNFTYSHSIVSKGEEAPGRLQSPVAVALDSAGNVYVSIRTEISNTWGYKIYENINVFTSDGIFIRQHHYELNNIVSIAVETCNLVYVVHSKDARANTISVFDTRGQHIKSDIIDIKGSNNCSVAVDTLSNLYVVDNANNRIVIF